MNVDQAIAQLNSKAAEAHRRFLDACTHATTAPDPAAAAMLARYNALLDAIETVRQIHTEEASHA